MPKMFEKGGPGGPGRPKGSRNIANVLLDRIATDGAEEMVKKMVEIAAAGDRVAARLVLSRIWAAPKGRAVEIDLPKIEKPADLVAAHAAIMAAIADERITPQDGAALASVLETHRRAFELVAQEGRVEKLETEVRAFREKFQCVSRHA